MTSFEQSSDERVRTALVTGGGRGLGLSIARALTARGYHVVTTHRPGRAETTSEPSADRLRDGAAQSIPLDLADVASFTGFRERLRRHLADSGASSLDVLMNNAGVGLFADFDDLTVEQFEDDIGLAVAALVDPDLAWVTGQRIEVAGGAFL